MRKYRHEVKYIISKNQAEILKQRLSYLLDYDKFSKNKDKSYIIKSLYFDDYENSGYYEKLDGVLYRKKYRIRVYNDDDRFIRLECKYKHNNLTSKDQTLISKEMYYKILNGNSELIDTFGDNLLEKFLMEMKIKNLNPCVIVEYKRTAFTYPLSNVRITFDEVIKSGRYNYDLFIDSPRYTVLGDDILVLEVKYDDVLPSIIENIISTVPIYRQAVSKFALARSIK